MKNMKKVAFMAATIILVAMTLTSCGKDNNHLVSKDNQIETEDRIMVDGYRNYEPDSSVVELRHQDGISDSAVVDKTPTIKAERTIHVAGTTGLERESAMPINLGVRARASEQPVLYNHNITNLINCGLTINVVINGVEQVVYCLDTLYLQASEVVVDETSTANGFLEKSHVVYSLVNHRGIVLDTAWQRFIVEEGYVPPTVVKVDTVWNDECGVMANGVYANGNITFAITRTGVVRTIWSNGTVDNEPVSESNSYAYSVTINGTASTSMVGTVNMSANGTANFGNGFSVKLTQVGNQSWCSHTLNTATLANNGDITFNTTYGNGHPTAMVHVNINTPRQLDHYDTVWNSDCGTMANGYYTALNSNGSYTITRTGVKRAVYNNGDIENVGNVTATTTYTYHVTTNGTVYNSMVSMLPVAFNGNTITFTSASGSVSFTFSQVGNQNWCNHSHIQGHLTMDGKLVVTGSYNGGTPTLEIPVTINPDPTPNPFFPDADILAGYATRYYTGQNDVYGTIHYWMKVRRHSDNGIEWREADEATTITAASFSTVTSAFNASGASVSVSSVLSTIDADLAAGWVPTWVNGGANGVKMGVEKISNSGNTITVATVGQTEAYHVNLINGSINQDPNQPLVGHWNGAAMVSEEGGTVMFTAAN